MLSNLWKRSRTAHVTDRRRRARATPRLESLEARDLLCIPAPVALTPGAPNPPGETWNAQQLTFEWTPVDDAAFYIFRVLFSPNDSAVTYERTVYDTVHVNEEFLPPGGLRWNVKAVHANGCTSQLSNHLYFMIDVGVTCATLGRPMPISPGSPDPDNPQVITQNPPTFRWNFLNGATHYTFYVQSHPDGPIWIPFTQIPNYYAEEIEYTPDFELPVGPALRWKIRGLFNTHAFPGQCLGPYASDLYFIISPGRTPDGGAVPRPESAPARTDATAISVVLAAAPRRLALATEAADQTATAAALAAAVDRITGPRQAGAVTETLIGSDRGRPRAVRWDAVFDDSWPGLNDGCSPFPS